MAYDEVLAGRLRDLAPPELAEKNVFGARCWVLDGNMAFGVHDDALLVRLGPDAAEGAGDATDGLTPFDPMGAGKPMKGWFLVSPDDVAEDDGLTAWMERALAFARTLPPK